MIRQGRWLTHPDVPWLPPGELQSDALLDLQTKGNSISVYEVRTGGDEDRIVDALAANRGKLDVFDYAIFEDTRFTQFGVTVMPCEGETPDASVNALHHELRNVTVRQLAAAADAVSSGTKRRILRKVVRSRLIQAIDNGVLRREGLNPQLRTELL